MKIRTTCLAALLASAAFPGAARAWDDAGHKAVAQIALDSLPAGSLARNRVEAILQTDPRATQPGGGRRPSLLSFAVWPDVIKHRPPSNANIDPVTGAPKDPDWHFVDIPFHLTRSAAVQREIDRPGVTVDPKDAASANVVTAIRFYANFLRSGAGTPAEQADALAWLTHLVGDVHQPLHCMTVVRPLPGYTPPATGDRGGNGFSLAGPPKNLHSFWDDQLDLDHASDPRHVPALDEAGIIARARALEQAHPVASLHGRERLLEPADWAKESFAQRQFVYSATVGQRPGDAYAARAKKIAGERLALAGYRLAGLLRAIFEP